MSRKKLLLQSLVVGVVLALALGMFGIKRISAKPNTMEYPLYRQRSAGLLPFLLLYMPDLSRLVLISGGLAGIWAFLRIGLILRTLRKPSSSPLGTWPATFRTS